MIIDNVNLNLLRIFESVYRTHSMTKAAEELHMTQSGVSQNIKNLEDFLGVRLFDRIKQRPVPTHQANYLFETLSKNLYDIDRVLIDLKGGSGHLSGLIHIGIPVDFGNNIILPMLAQLGIEHPHVSFSIKYGHASEMNELLLLGKIDFAFVDNYGLDKIIKTEKVQDELLSMCCSKSYLQQIGEIGHDRKFFESLDYIDYVEEGALTKMWLETQMKIKNPNIKIRASLMNVQGVSRLIAEGLGVGVLPLHVVARIKKYGHDLYQFEENGAPMTNSISVAYIENRSKGPSQELIIQSIVKNLKEHQPDFS